MSEELLHFHDKAFADSRKQARFHNAFAFIIGMVNFGTNFGGRLFRLSDGMIVVHLKEALIVSLPTGFVVWFVIWLTLKLGSPLDEVFLFDTRLVLGFGRKKKEIHLRSIRKVLVHLAKTGPPVRITVVDEDNARFIINQLESVEQFIETLAKMLPKDVPIVRKTRKINYPEKTWTIILVGLLLAVVAGCLSALVRLWVRWMFQV